jgi:hypothetical protein
MDTDDAKQLQVRGDVEEPFSSAPKNLWAAVVAQVTSVTGII